MGNEKFQAPTPTTNNSPAASADEHTLPTFLDHVHELRRRLFWIVGTVIATSSIAYSFLGTILDILTAPLGEQGLFYLTPGGGLSFSFKLCALVGILVAVPFIMYHLYRFIEPLMGNWRRPTIFYVGFSTILAVSGVLFAYYVSLPAAISFLTGFNVNHVQAMLTADSYLSFVATYLLGAAILFQIPLLLMIINNMTPLKPSKLMKLQKYVIVGAFILAAIISPTPDIMNQAFLAIPIIGMYQLGIMLVWLQNTLRMRKQARLSARATQQQMPQVTQAITHGVPEHVLQDLVQPARSVAPTPIVQPVKKAATSVASSTASMRPAQPAAARPVSVRRPVQAQPVRVFSDIAPRRQVAAMARPVNSVSRQVIRPVVPQQVRSAPKLAVPTRSIDGFSSYRQANAVGAP